MLSVLDGCPMIPAGRQQALTVIERITVGGTTALSSGWFEGARCTAGVMERQVLRGGHVLVLSDGRANKGLMDPGELIQHALELAQRGIKTSAVGMRRLFSSAAGRPG